MDGIAENRQNSIQKFESLPKRHTEFTACLSRRRAAPPNAANALIELLATMFKLPPQLHEVARAKRNGSR
jgi:hypothetical protein